MFDHVSLSFRDIDDKLGYKTKTLLAVPIMYHTTKRDQGEHTCGTLGAMGYDRHGSRAVASIETSFFLQFTTAAL